MRRLRVLPHPAENGTAELTPASDRRIREASPGAARFCIHETRAVSSPDDSGLLLDMFDDGVAWLVARGQPEQWGTEPFSQRPEGCKRAQDLAASGGLWIAEIGEEPVGALSSAKLLSTRLPSIVPSCTSSSCSPAVATPARGSGRA